ncbi:hypothetical protein [Streptomyces sp. NPDC006551]|uniref:hypothetical protein n=1 Tax=Streptomyces sp. NPDC006551 TaxID=3157178 RepID=UPI0033B85FF7
MTAYHCARPTDWERSVPGVAWLGDAAPEGAPPYPPVLDAVESALILRPTPMLRAAAGALAPRWEELGRAQEPSDPDRADSTGEEDDTEERLVLYGAARAVSELGAGFGYALAVSADSGPNLRYFATHLARLAQGTGFSLACVGDASAFPATAVVRRTARPPDEAVAPPETPVTELAAADRQALTIVAISHWGAPVTAALRLGLSREAADRLGRPGPGGNSWISLTSGTRHTLRSGLDARDSSRHAAALFDAWQPAGWDYIRRAELAVMSGDRARLREQHAALFTGCAIIGRDLLQRHAAATAIALEVPGGDPPVSPDQRVAAHVAAARLAPRLRPESLGDTEATRHFRSALRLSTEPVERLDLTYELANHLAKQRTPDSLNHARRLYAEGLDELCSVEDTAQRARLEITLLNGLALVDYFEGNNESALSLEQQAEVTAGSLTETRPDLARWAFALLGVNTAKLLAARFSDRQGAIRKLVVALKTSGADPDRAEKIRRSLGRLYFKEGDYPQVIAMLNSLCPPGRLGNVSSREDFQDRLLLAVAHLTLGRMGECRAQLPQLRVLANREGSEAAASALDVLAQASLAPASPAPESSPLGV